MPDIPCIDLCVYVVLCSDDPSYLLLLRHAFVQKTSFSLLLFLLLFLLLLLLLFIPLLSFFSLLLRLLLLLLAVAAIVGLSVDGLADFE